ncbi:MAG: serine/threonine protein kinase [Planctomycetota bacterium]
MDDANAALLDTHFSSCHACLYKFVEAGRNPLIPTIPGYHIVKEVGRGRFGVVYKAWRTKDTPAVVALKILSEPGDMEVSRFDREIAVLKRIESSGVVRCIDSGTHGDLIYLVMDFIEGQHLDVFFKTRTATLGDKLRVFERICEAVADAHLHGVVHRDLKPKNILVDEEGRPHILDFGICTVEQEDWTGLIAATITQAGDIIGTLKYMSPEQAWGGGIAGNVGPRSDIWALGVMLYEIVTNGRYPYPEGKYRNRPKHEALLEQIRKDLPEKPDLSHLPSGHELETLLERCLAWEPEYRLDSAQRLGEDIGRYLRDEPIHTRPLWFTHRLRRLAVGAATQSRWMFTLGFVTLVGVAVWVMTFLFNVRWFTTNDMASGNESSIDPVLVENPRDQILVAGISDESVPAVVDFAARQGLPGVTEDLRTWRRVHAVLMSRIAVAAESGAAPRVLTFDYYFETERDADKDFVGAIHSLERTGVPVVLASFDYAEDGTPRISERIRSGLGRVLRHGSIAARNQLDRPGEFLLAINRPDATLIPTLPLATFAAALHPDAVLEMRWKSDDRKLELSYEVATDRYLRPRDPVHVARDFHQKIPGIGVRRDDQVLVSVYELDAPETWEARTVAYEMLLSCSQEELAGYVNGKLMIVGDLQQNVPASDRHTVKYGIETVENVPGCYLIGDAVSGLFSGRHAKLARMLKPTTLVSMLMLAVCGCLIPIPLARHRLLDRKRNRNFLWMGLFSFAVGSLSLMFLTQSYPAVHTGMAGFSLFTPMIGSFWVEFARNRHRVLDERRREVIDFSQVSSGTLTLGLKPS